MASVTSHSDFGTQENKICHCFHFFPLLFAMKLPVAMILVFFFFNVEFQAGIKIAGRNINNLRYTEDTTLVTESEEKLKSLLMRVKEESKTAGLKFNTSYLENCICRKMTRFSNESWLHFLEIHVLFQLKFVNFVYLYEEPIFGFLDFLHCFLFSVLLISALFFIIPST